MVVFGRVEAVERFHFGDDRLNVGGPLAQNGGLYGGQVGFVLPVDAASVLSTPVVALPVEDCGVYCLEEGVQEQVGGQYRAIVGDGNGFRMPGVP